MFFLLHEKVHGGWANKRGHLLESQEYIKKLGNNDFISYGQYLPGQLAKK